MPNLPEAQGPRDMTPEGVECQCGHDDLGRTRRSKRPCLGLPPIGPGFPPFGHEVWPTFFQGPPACTCPRQLSRDLASLMGGRGELCAPSSSNES